MNTKLVELFKLFAVKQWRWYLAGMLMLLLTSWVSLIIPELSKEIVNSYSDMAERDSLKQTALYIIGLGFMLLLVRALSRILLFWPARVLETEVKDYYYARFLKVQQKFMERLGMGDLISRIANDVTHIRVFFGFGALQVLNFFFMVTLAIYKMGVIDPYLTVFALAPILSNIVFMRFAMPRMHKYSRAQQDKLGILTNKITESFVNIHIIQSNEASNSFSGAITEANSHVYKTNVKVAVFRTIVFPILGLMTGFSYLVVLFYGGKLAMEGKITIGDLMAFNAYLALLSFPLMAIGIVLAVTQRARTAADRLAEIDAAETETPQDSETNINIKAPYTIEIKNLNFSFDQKKNVISDLSLKVNPGDHVGIVGTVGSGKSVLFNLITRLYDPPRGSIFINNVDVLDLPPTQIRSIVGYATQTVHLFSDSVMNNLTFGMENSDSDETKELAKKATKEAEIYEDIEGFDHGWESEVGEKGLRLSGGQKQRLALARTLLRNPPVYLLDDTLSAVDYSTEKNIITSLRNKNATMLISTHRSSAIKHCETVIALDDGKVVAKGTFAELSKSHSHFFETEDK